MSGARKSSLALATCFAQFRKLYEFPITFHLVLSGWNGGKESVLPHLIGYDIDLTIVRAVADLARLEEWDDMFSAVLARLQNETPQDEVTSRESVRPSVSNKLAILSPYITLIGVAGAVASAALFLRFKHDKTNST
jgi:hypothetical protein